MDLNPVALLRAIAAPGWESQADLARHAGRDPKNMARDLAVLRKADLIAADGIALTDHGAAQLAALDRAENPADGLGVTLALHGDLIPDPDQPRKDFTSTEALTRLAELEESIILRGRILQPIAVRPVPGGTDPGHPQQFLITDGERRWRAVGQAIEAGHWPADRPMPITIQDTDALETRLSQLTANMVRADMTPLEECDAFADLVDNHGFETRDIAALLGINIKTVQNRLRLRALSPEARHRMALPDDHPDHLGYKAALSSLIQPRESGSPIPPPPGEVARSDSGVTEGATPPFDTTLTELQALTLIEIADWIERARDPLVGTGHYAPIDAVPTGPLTSGLMHRGLIGFRGLGAAHHVTLRFSAEGLTDWLTGLGFYGDGRADALFEARLRAGITREAASTLALHGRYATAWLNRGEAQPVWSPSPRKWEGDREAVEGLLTPPASGIGGGLVCRPDPNLTQAEIDAAFAASASLADQIRAATDQPALIPPSLEEREAQYNLEQARAQAERDAAMIDRFADAMTDTLSIARDAPSMPLHDATGADGSNAGLDSIVEAAFASLVQGDAPAAGAALALLWQRGRLVGSRLALMRFDAVVVRAGITGERAATSGDA